MFYIVGWRDPQSRDSIKVAEIELSPYTCEDMAGEAARRLNIVEAEIVLFIDADFYQQLHSHVLRADTHAYGSLQNPRR